jgi:hypothetical protein
MTQSPRRIVCYSRRPGASRCLALRQLVGGGQSVRRALPAWMVSVPPWWSTRRCVQMVRTRCRFLHFHGKHRDTRRARSRTDRPRTNTSSQTSPPLPRLTQTTHLDTGRRSPVNFADAVRLYSEIESVAVVTVP